MNFKLTDNRPWYKQVLSGALLVPIILLAGVMAGAAGVALFILVWALFTVVDWGVAITVMGGALLLAAVMVGYFSLYLWAKGEW